MNRYVLNVWTDAPGLRSGPTAQVTVDAMTAMDARRKAIGAMYLVDAPHAWRCNIASVDTTLPPSDFVATLQSERERLADLFEAHACDRCIKAGRRIRGEAHSTCGAMLVAANLARTFGEQA